MGSAFSSVTKKVQLCVLFFLINIFLCRNRCTDFILMGQGNLHDNLLNRFYASFRSAIQFFKVQIPWQPPLSYGTYAALEIKSTYMQRWNRMTCKLFLKYSHFGGKNMLHRHIFSQLPYILWKNHILYNAINQVLDLFINNIEGNCTLCFSDLYVHVCIYAYIYIAK